MKRSAILVLAGAAGIPSMAVAQEPVGMAPMPPPAAEAPLVEEEKAFSANVSLNQDNFFGFYPTMAAGYRIGEGLDFTFYSILWTTPSFSTGALADAPNGDGLWTEVGAGVSFNLLDDQLAINPQLGILSGRLLSGGDDQGRSLAAEGIVPNLTVNYDGEYVEAELYFGYYLALRGDRAFDFIHWWANAGVKPFGEDSLLSAGAHFEHLRAQRIAGGDPADLYMWLGPYVQLSLPEGVGLRFAAGVDLEDGVSSNFYKATVGMDF